MQTLNYWKQFENTGKIEDYLTYKNSYSGREAEDYAGFSTGDRDDFEAVPGRGVRPEGMHSYP